LTRAWALFPMVREASLGIAAMCGRGSTRRFGAIMLGLAMFVLLRCLSAAGMAPSRGAAGLCRNNRAGRDKALRRRRIHPGPGRICPRTRTSRNRAAVGPGHGGAKRRCIGPLGLRNGAPACRTGPTARRGRAGRHTGVPARWRFAPDLRVRGRMNFPRLHIRIVAARHKGVLVPVDRDGVFVAIVWMPDQVHVGRANVSVLPGTWLIRRPVNRPCC
jgi:hypothetical protein